MLIALGTGITLLIALLLAIDDLFFDLLFYFRRKNRKSKHQIHLLPQRRLAIVIPLFQSTAQSAGILSKNLKTIDYENFQVFLGFLPNDSFEKDSNQKVSSLKVSESCGVDKGRFLNEMMHSILQREDQASFEGFIFLSWRDEWHPKILSIVNESLEDHSVMQVPALSHAPKARSLVLGAFADEITEMQQREISLRADMGVPFPLNSSGLVLSRSFLISLKRNQGEIFTTNIASQIEPLTMAVKDFPFKPIWLQEHYRRGSRSELISTKITLPPNRAAAIAWKTARTKRILENGLAHFFSMGAWEKYFFWRDTRTTWASLIKSLAAVFLILALIQTAGAMEVMPLWMQNLSLLNGALWLRRILGRMICLKGVHNWSHTLLAPFRWPMGNMLHSLSSWRAVRSVGAQAWRARFSQVK